MANSFFDKNKFEEAQECLDKALAIFDSVQIDESQKYGKCQCLWLKGILKREIADQNGAVQAIAPCIAMLEELFVLQPEVAEFLTEAYEMIVNLHYQRGDLEQAHKYSKKGLDFIDKTLGKNNLKGHNLARELAYTLTRQHREPKALVYVEKWQILSSIKTSLKKLKNVLIRH